MNIKEDFKRHVNSHFLAGDENIRFIPNFTFNDNSNDSAYNNKNKIELICRIHEIGPIEAGIDIVVPLWLGVLLKQRNMGHILLPEWMSVSNLKNVLSYEKDIKKDSFSSQIPFRYIEISRLILSVEGNNSSSNSTGDGGEGGNTSSETNDGNINQIRLLLEDIISVRMDKIRRNMHTLSQQFLSQDTTLPAIDVTNIGSIEIATMKTFITQTFRNHLYLSRKEKQIQEDNEGGKQLGGRGNRSSTLLREAAASSYQNNKNKRTSTIDGGDDDDDHLNITKSTADTTFEDDDDESDDNDNDEGDNDENVVQEPINTTGPTRSRIRRFR